MIGSPIFDFQDIKRGDMIVDSRILILLNLSILDCLIWLGSFVRRGEGDEGVEGEGESAERVDLKAMRICFS